ncbi:glutamine synthetase family protein [Treponema brennaborense]|uniref:Glutamine synthetase catalytic region n=1 Tax=Treponema brennaborense (strain DSM 12168 / CIP 105900 / DD5/3) TaxID=906968 RepID=F4LQB1_TREBD|nr:glutamine synthetase family protein [Treponema brennaborense]AEE16132.1 glutamine synthetase catalytic region [Treponema brennaborense DSM 12168]
MNYTQSEVLQYIAENDVKFIKLFFTDIFGSIKSISIMPEQLPTAFKWGIPFDASCVKGFLEVAKTDLFIVPDPATLAVLPWRPQHGRVVRFYCNIRYPDGAPFAGDSRLILQQTADKIRELGYTCKIGTDCEFYLFNADENGQPTLTPQDQASYCDLAPRDRGENVRRDICLTLEQMGIKPEASHHEKGPGQNEIDFADSDVLNAADNFATFKTVVRTIAARNGLFASFMPKPLADRSGSGLHVNISLKKDGCNVFEGEKLRPEAESFIAGILHHIKDITAFLNPLNNSYDRFGEFEAPQYVSWSRWNLSQLIRFPASGGKDVRIKVRSPDPACNQYLALALILSSGLDGIANKRPLPPATDIDLCSAPPQTIAGLPKLPGSLKEALAFAAASPFVADLLTKDVLDMFAAAKSGGRDPDFGEI